MKTLGYVQDGADDDVRIVHEKVLVRIKQVVVLRVRE